MNINEAFGSNLKAEDVLGREIPVTISAFSIEDMGDGVMKPVIQFTNAKKGLVLNVTRKEQMVALYGIETDQWIGKPLILSHGMTSYQGKPTGTILIKGPPAPVAAPVVTAPVAAPAPPAVAPAPSAFSEEVPPPLSDDPFGV